MDFHLIKGMGCQHHVAHGVGTGEIFLHITQCLAADKVFQRLLQHGFRRRVQHQRRDTGKGLVPANLGGHHGQLAVTAFIHIAGIIQRHLVSGTGQGLQGGARLAERFFTLFFQQFNARLERLRLGTTALARLIGTHPTHCMVFTHQVGNHLASQFIQACFSTPAIAGHLLFQQAHKIVTAHLTVPGRLTLRFRQGGGIFMDKGNNRFALGGGEDVLTMDLAEPHRRQGAVAAAHNQDEIITGFDQLLDHRQQGIAVRRRTIQAGRNQPVLQHGQYQCLARALHIRERGADKDLIAFVGCRAHPDQNLFLCYSGPPGRACGGLLKRLNALITSQPADPKAGSGHDMGHFTGSC